MSENMSHSIYAMHKYWGKKPAKELRQILAQYSKEHDKIVDPFSGYGGIGVESVLMNRQVIVNDLNPMSNFISRCILSERVDFQSLQDAIRGLQNQYDAMHQQYYHYNGEKIISILRDRNDKPLMLKLVHRENKKMYEVALSEAEAQKWMETEQNMVINHWFPEVELLENSRISAKNGMKIQDLFSKRALLCQSYLYSLIEALPNSEEKDLLKLSFTANLANCSKLVPPIKSRGPMAQGAWMTGFYVGEEYLENNVFHYFENRVKKTVKGKKDYIQLRQSADSVGTYQITNMDAKALDIPSETIDFVFTDFPYGDTVPYFEQSQLWNAWMKFPVDYQEEIVISDSKPRHKKPSNFESDIQRAVAEISRILKDNSYFVFTYHSLSGREWNAISNAMVEHKFHFVESTLLQQKSFSPRQLNRKQSVKGDLIVVYQKRCDPVPCGQRHTVAELLEKKVLGIDKNIGYSTNDVLMLCINSVLESGEETKSIDFLEMIAPYFIFQNDEWRYRNDVQ